MIWLGVIAIASMATLHGMDDESYIGHTILEQVLRHAPRNLPVDMLNTCACVSKHVATFAQLRLKDCVEWFGEWVQKNLPNENLAYSDDCLAVGFTCFENGVWYNSFSGIAQRIVQMLAGQVCTLIREDHVESYVKKRSPFELERVRYAHAPMYVNGTFCWGHVVVYKYSKNDIELMCMDRRTGDMCGHPFGTVALSEKERKKLATYFALRQGVCNPALSWSTISTMKPEMQYTFANLFALSCFSEFLIYVHAICGLNKYKFSACGTLELSGVADCWVLNNTLVHDGDKNKIGPYTQATRNYLKKLIQEKILVDLRKDDVSSCEKQVKQWQQIVEYLKNERILVKHSGSKIMRYDVLSNTVCVMSCGIRGIKEEADGKQEMITPVSKPLQLPNNVKPKSLRVAEDCSISYKLRGDPEKKRYVEEPSF